MNKELYNNLFTLLDSLGVVRNNGIFEIEEPILSDCLNCFTLDTYKEVEWAWCFVKKWDLSKPYLHQQSDELWNKLFELLS